MRDVAITGVGMTPVGEHWQDGLRLLAADAIKAALEDAEINTVDALYIGNAYGATCSSQSHLGTLVADYAGLGNIEAYTVEAGDASGGVALRTGYLAVASGAVDTALVVGVEKSSDSIAGAQIEARNVSLDADYESIQGATLPALAALLMKRYMYEYNVALEAFEGFSINAHANGRLNPNAMFKNTIKVGAFGKAPMIANPINLFDGAPDADGAAAIILTAANLVNKPHVQIIGSAIATDTLAIQDRKNLLNLDAVTFSTQKAFQQAGITKDDVDLFELHDAFTILSTLALESAGFAERGTGWQYAKDGKIGLDGKLPISTFGGLKSRGNPAGATGIYQAAEATLQLRGTANNNQVQNAGIALIQNMGGIASTVATHVLARI